MDDGNRNNGMDNITSDSVQSSIKIDPQSGAHAVAARIEPITEHTNHEYDKSIDVVCDNNNSTDRDDNKLGTGVNEKDVSPSSKCVASVTSVAEIDDKNNGLNEKEGLSSCKSVACVASVADNDATSVGLPEIPCAWCDYKHTIEFDLGNHLLANHRGELMKMPVGNGSMEIRIDYAIQQTKRMIARSTTMTRMLNLMTMNNSISHSEIISGNVDFILSHFQEPMFPRKIMTKRLGHQKEVFSKQEALKYFESSDYKDCRINAYPSFTNYQGITRVAPSFVMIDLDLRDFGNSRDNLDRGQNKILKRINALTRGYSTVLWTGNGYHIYQPMEGFILEEEERFARLRELDGKDLTSKFIHFAEEYLTNKKEDPLHNPTVNSCLVRVPGTINSKCAQEVKIIQRWDGQKPPINYLLRCFRVWLINEKMQRKLIDSKRAQTQTANPTIIPWIEKLLQIPLDDHRKFVVWRIQSPYLINIRKYSVEEASNLIKNWLDKCNQLKSLDFNPNYMIKYNINSAKRNGYLPISLEKLRIENTYLYNMLAKSKVNNKLTYS